MKLTGPSPEDWEEAVRQFPVGSIIRGRVIARMPFGVFLELPETTVKALIRLTDLDPASTPTPPFSEGVPLEGEEVEAIVIGHGVEKQIVCSRRLDHYDRFSEDAEDPE